MITIKKIINYYNWGGRFLSDPYHKSVSNLRDIEINKQPLRSDVINFLLNNFNRQTIYLEIGVRNPALNFNKIISDIKYSVDPGIEFKENPVDFKVTSDEFFKKLNDGDILNTDIKFDVIFIDGLHLADQVDRDIKNALEYIEDDGFIVLHDCNPPSQWHAREEHNYELSPAMNDWNGTTWKAFVKCRANKELYSCCIDTDWGVGVISKNKNLGNHSLVINPYYEYSVFNLNRKESLNLISFKEFQEKFK